MKGVNTETGLGCIGFAVEQLKAGENMARKGWNGKDLYLYYIPTLLESTHRLPIKKASKPKSFIELKLKEDEIVSSDWVPALSIYSSEYIVLCAKKNGEEKVSTWSPSISDTLAEDWYIV